MFAKVLKWLTGIQWDQTKLFDASSAHIGWAAFGTLGFILLFHIPFLLVWLGFLAFSAVKEYVVDLTVEKSETVWSSTVDAITYQIGVFLAGLTLLMPWLGLLGSIVLLLGMAVLDYRRFFTWIENKAKLGNVGKNRYDYDCKKTDFNNQ